MKVKEVKAILNNELTIDILLDENPTLSKVYNQFKRNQSSEELITKEAENKIKLKDILGNNNELYICFDPPITRVKIYTHTHLNNVMPRWKSLPSEAYLDEVRSKLEMASNSVFFHLNADFDRSDEASTKWIDISSKDDKNLKLEIRRDGDIDWNKLMEQCDSGLLYENENIQTAQLKAFTIDITKIKPNLYLQPPSENVKFKCEQRFDSVFKERLIIKGQIASTLPYLSVLLDISYDKVNELQKSRVVSTEYTCELIRKAEIKFIKELNIKLNDDFVKKVKLALKDPNPLKKLGEITKEYGHFYASEIIFGGAIIEKNNYRQEKGVNHVNVNCEVQNEIEESMTKILDISKLTTIGGKDTLYSKKDSQKWNDSVDDSKYWRIISYKIQPIFDLLDDELRNRVLESFGKQILKEGIKPIDIRVPFNGSIHVNFDDETGDIADINKCQIFASLMNKQKVIDVFSVRIEYADNNSPYFVIHHIGSKESKKRNFNIAIGWFIIGYPRNFEFKQKNCMIKVFSEERDLNEEGAQNSFEITDNFICKQDCKLVMSELSIPKSSNIDLHKSNIVIGAHFTESGNKICTFTHDLDNSSADKLSEFRSHSNLKIVYSSEKNLCSIIKSCSTKHENFAISLFVNLLNECNYHGFVNLTPKFPIYYLISHENGQIPDNFNCGVSYFIKK
ncbi:17694_t:CDS:2 [Gigaspora margarita]|uniref:17694_t:CDS:1 n=1 Tax=Gigaspora margarita TaxID=4874 RepID=A0ABN7UVW6_GIGMA|nr:17694_t:CDS:2 [Gigaspora margarita]